MVAQSLARRIEALSEYQNVFAEKGYEVNVIACDVTDLESVRSAFAQVHDEIGTPDVLVYNMGITTPDEQPLTEQDIIRHFKAYSCITAVANEKSGKKNGTILLTGGVALKPTSIGLTNREAYTQY